METAEKLGAVLDRYKLVLELARTQRAMLESGKIEDLPAVLDKKSRAVEEAGVFMAELRALDGEKEKALVREWLPRLTSLVEEVMTLEDICQRWCAPRKPKAPAAPSRVASLYQKNLK